MLTFLTWKWQAPSGYRSQFAAEHVIALGHAIARHYPRPHRFICVTDDARGLESIETFQLWPDYEDVPSPHGRSYPSCYRRLKAFSREAGDWFGARFVSLDLDTVITGDLRPLVDRDEDFVVWGDSDTPKTSFYNGSLWMLRAGTRACIWEDFDPTRSPQLARAAGAMGSDQGWLSYRLGRGEATWGVQDGVYSYRRHVLPHGGALPAEARVVSFHGRVDPWSPAAQRHAWVREHWGARAEALSR